MIEALEEKNTLAVIDVLAQLIPAHDPQALEVPCNLESESHAGIRLGESAKGFLVLHRCQLEWWVRFIEPHDVPKLSGPLANYALASAEANPFMAANTGPREAAMAIATAVA